VTTFIKAEEQNYSLYNYVNMLNTEIDTIEEQNKVIAQEIRKHELKGDLSEKEKQAAIDELQEEIDIAHSLKKTKKTRTRILKISSQQCNPVCK
jgi:fructose-1,6-bisphosphatase